MLLGKFLPPHLGHAYLCDFAQNFVDDLDIVVGTLEREPIPGALRYGWMQQMFPEANVLHLDEDLPQEPSEHPQFWAIWKRALLEILPAKPDFVFASETYGQPLADILDATFIPVDRARGIRPVSGTAIRDDPFGNWEFIPPAVRPYFVKTVCVFGPESTGKSTLNRDLASTFETIGVPEYARTYLEERGAELTESDLLPIARGQVASQRALAPHANRILVTDTDALLTTVWADFLHGRCDPQVQELAKSHRADLYLLTKPDVPWVPDPVRYLPENRGDFFERCRDALDRIGAPYVIIEGTWEQRKSKAIQAVNRLRDEESG